MSRVNLRELIEANLRGRSWNALATDAGVKSASTIRNWADGRYPMPEFRADAIATFLGVPADDVIAAADESSRAPVRGVRQSSPAAEGAVGGRALTVDERDEIVRTLAAVGQQLLDLAEKIRSVDGEQP